MDCMGSNFYNSWSFISGFYFDWLIYPFFADFKKTLRELDSFWGGASVMFFLGVLAETLNKRQK